MPLADSVPGMRAKSPVRNALLSAAYLVLLPVAIVFLPVTLAAVVGFNVRGAADRLTVLPGVGRGGGVVAALFGAAFGFLLLAALDVVLPDERNTTRREIDGAAVFEARPETPAAVTSSGDESGTRSGPGTRA